MFTTTHKFRRPWIFALVMVFVVFPAAVAMAQLNSGMGNVNVNASVRQSLTVAVSAGSTVNFVLVPGNTSTGDKSVTIQTSWSLNPSVNNVSLYAYFDIPAQALTDGSGNSIPSSLVRGRVTTGTPTQYNAFNQINPLGAAGGALQLFAETITGVNKNKTRTDNLDLEIDLTALPALPAGNYVGTLRVQARAL